MATGDDVMQGNLKRVNVLIRPDQHEEANKRGLSLSGLVRDLLDDRFSETNITLSLSRDTKRLYDHAISNFGADDLQLERYIVAALDQFLSDKAKEIDGLRKRLNKKK